MSIKKDLTIVFNSYYSEKQLSRVLKKLYSYKIIIIENSRDQNIKKRLEKKFKNIKVLIPAENLGLANGYNLGIKKTNSKYIFLNNPDIQISNNSIKKLYLLAKKIKNFGIIAPIYKDEKIHKNYSSYEIKINKNLSAVNWIDNNYFVKASVIKKNLFNKNFFLYFENLDFCKNLIKKGNKLYIAKNIKFNHFGSKSVDAKYNNIIILTRAWHYNWSKFYYYRKNYNYVFALTKILPNIYQATKNFIISLVKLNFFKSKSHLIEIYGIICALLLIKSFYRAKK